MKSIAIYLICLLSFAEALSQAIPFSGRVNSLRASETFYRAYTSNSIAEPHIGAFELLHTENRLSQFYPRYNNGHFDTLFSLSLMDSIYYHYFSGTDINDNNFSTHVFAAPVNTIYAAYMNQEWSTVDSILGISPYRLGMIEQAFNLYYYHELRYLTNQDLFSGDLHPKHLANIQSEYYDQLFSNEDVVQFFNEFREALEIRNGRGLSTPLILSKSYNLYEMHKEGDFNKLYDLFEFDEFRSIVGVLAEAAHEPVPYLLSGEDLWEPEFICLENETKKWQYQIAYDEHGYPYSESMVYLDKMQRPLQHQWKLFSKGQVMASENLYSQSGGAAGSTLSAPINSQNLCYKEHFFTNQQGTPYTFLDFNKKSTPANAPGELRNPKPVQGSIAGSLGWFYGSGNAPGSTLASAEEYVDQTQYPFSTQSSIYFGSGYGIQSAPLEAQRMGLGKEQLTVVVQGQGELDYVFGTNLSPYIGFNPSNSNIPKKYSFGFVQATKSISKGPDGRYLIEYTDDQGLLVASCYSGTGLATCPAQLKGMNILKFNSLSETVRTRIHLPKSKKNTLVVYKPNHYCGHPGHSSNGLLKLFDIIDNRFLEEGLSKDYTFSYDQTTRAINFTFNPNNKSEFIEISFKYNDNHLDWCVDHEIKVEYGLDYALWTLYQYDITGRLVATIPPKGIDCGFSPIHTSNVGTHPTTALSTTGITTISIAPEPPTVVNLQQTPLSHLGMYGSYLFTMRTPHTVNGGPPPPPPCTTCVYPDETIFEPPLSGRGVVSYIAPSMNQFLVFDLEYDTVSSSFPFQVEDPEPGFTQGLPVYGIVPSDTTKFSIQLNQNKWDSVVMACTQLLDFYEQNEISPEWNIPIIDGFPARQANTGPNAGSPPIHDPSWTTRTYNIEGTFKVTYKNVLGQSNEEIIKLNIYVQVVWLNNIFSVAIWRGLDDNRLIRFNSELRNMMATDIEVEFLGQPYFKNSDNKLDAVSIPSLTGGSTIPLKTFMLSKVIFELNEGKTHWIPNQLPNHKMQKTIAYDALDQPVKSTSPDAGELRSVHNTFGELKLSQDAQQRLEGKFSYLIHDRLGRSTEAGVFKGATISAANTLFDWFYNRDQVYVVSNPTVWHNINKDLDNLSRSHLTNGVFEEVSNSLYDVQATDLPTVHGVTLVQRNLGGKLSRTSTETGYKTWYSYDGFDRLEWVIIMIPQIGPKTIHYKYDLLGNLLEQDVNRHKADERFVHHYTYDADKQLANVETSCNGISRVQEARYKYYLTGALKRTELAGNLQGIDYVYNINGALKAVNHPELDPNKDPGRDGTSGSGFLPDYFGYVIDYHDQDYNRPFADFKSGVSSTATSTYSGLPRSTRWKTLTNVGISTQQSMYKYDFDDQGQLKEARLGTFNNSTSVYSSAAQAHDEYDINYDPNGNITGLKRTASGNQLHNLNYTYTTETNKLASVTNSSNAFRTYSYYANGQVSTVTEHGSPTTTLYLKYDDAGHVLEICKAANFTFPVVRFEYNELGHRVAKHSYHPSTYQLTQSTFYLRDPSGRLLSVYTKTPGLPAQERERYLYGMDMIGVMQMDAVASPPGDINCEECPPPPPPLSVGMGCTGQRIYYLKDQVGNVRVILLRGTTAGTPPLAFQNYYPFGMTHPGGLTSSFTQRFGYQGEYAEQDPETKLAAFEARMYDAITGRWLAVDPQHQFHSPYLAMGNNPVMMVDPDGEFAFLVPLIAGAIIGGGMNLFFQGMQGNILTFEDGLKAFGVGAVAGAGAALTGGAVAGAIGVGGFAGGAIVGASAGAVGGFINGAGNSWASGADFWQGMENGGKSAAIGALAGGIMGGVGGGIKAKFDGADFWTGRFQEYPQLTANVDCKVGDNGLKFHSSNSYVYDDGHFKPQEQMYKIKAGQHVKVNVKNENFLGVELELQDQTKYTFKKGFFGLDRKVFPGDSHNFILTPKGFIGSSKSFNFYSFRDSPMHWNFMMKTNISHAALVSLHFYSTWVPSMPSSNPAIYFPWAK